MIGEVPLNLIPDEFKSMKGAEVPLGMLPDEFKPTEITKIPQAKFETDVPLGQPELAISHVPITAEVTPQKPKIPSELMISTLTKEPEVGFIERYVPEFMKPKKGILTPTDVAKAQNVVQISKVTNLPLAFIEQNYDKVARETARKAGIYTEPTSQEMIQGLMYAAIGAGMLTHPVGTLVGVGTYMGIKEAESLGTQLAKKEKLKVLAGRELKEFLGPLAEPYSSMVDTLEFLAPGAVGAKFTGMVEKKLSDRLVQKYVREAWDEAILKRAEAEKGRLLPYRPGEKQLPLEEVPPVELTTLVEPTPKPVTPIPKAPKITKPELVKPIIKGQEVPPEMVPIELTEVVKPEVKPKEAIPPTAQHLELMPEEYPNIEAVAVKQDGKVYKDHSHASIVVENKLDPEKSIPGFVTKEGKFVEQYPKPKVEEVKPSPEPSTLQTEEHALLKKSYSQPLSETEVNRLKEIRFQQITGPKFAKVGELDRQIAEQEVKVEALRPTEPLPEEKVSKEALPVSEEGVEKGISPRVETVTAPSEARPIPTTFDLLNWVRSKGGINPETISADIQSLTQKESGFKGKASLVRKGGRGLDELAQEFEWETGRPITTDELTQEIKDTVESKKKGIPRGPGLGATDQDIAKFIEKAEREKYRGNIVAADEKFAEPQTFENLTKSFDDEIITFREEAIRNGYTEGYTDWAIEKARTRIKNEKIPASLEGLRKILSEEITSRTPEVTPAISKIQKDLGITESKLPLEERVAKLEKAGFTEEAKKLQLSATAKDQFALPGIKQGLEMRGGKEVTPTLEGTPLMEAARKSEVEKVQPGLFGKPVSETEMASVGTYDVGGGGVAAERPKEPSGRMVNIIEMPEMVELYNELTQGEYPKIKKILRAFRGQAAGTYRPGTEKIDLRSDIFKDPAQAKAVLAHEIGHLIDDLPEHILKQRGNIFGRIASLKNYLKKYLEEYEGAPGPLTKGDRTRLMKEAREVLKLEKATAEEQVATFKDMKLTPEDVKAIWNDVEARNKNKPVYEFIVSLSEVEKNQIVREAMRGIVSEANQRRFRISMPIEGRPFKDWDQRLRDIFNRLVKEELEKRRLFTYDNIMGELKNLTTTWKPFTPIPGSTMTKYRFSPQELYADAISVLFNNPGLLADKAPNFYKGFFNYIHRKPDVKQVYDDIQARIGMGEEPVLGHRREQVKVMFQRGEEALAELRKTEPYNIIESLRTAFISRREGLLKLKREAQRKGVKIDPEKDPDYWTEELPYISSPIFDMVRDVNNNILKPAQKDGITQSDIGEYLLYRREATERAKMANPKGYTEADALKQMDFLKSKMGDGKFNKLTALVKKSWEIREKDIFPVLEKSRTLYPDTLKLIKNNEEYTTFQVREYMENKYGPNMSAKIYRQLGTLKEVINPLTATVMKDMSLIRMAERKMIAESVVNFLKENFPKEITPAKTIWSGKYHEIVKPDNPKQGLIAYSQEGKITGYYVPKSIANIFSKDPYDFQPILRVLSVIQKPFKEILVSKNPGWWVWNIQRDLKALAKQVPGMDIPTAVKYAIKSLPDAYKDVFKDVSTEDVRAMYQLKSLGVGRYWSSSELGPETHLDKIVQSFGETPTKYDWNVSKPYQIIWEYLKAGSMLLDKFGAIGERIPKIAAYKFLKENTSLPDKQISHLIRKRAGSPDFWEKGGLDFLYNNVFWFSNAGKEGIRSALEAAKENPGAYTWKTVKYDILPKLLMLAASVGLLGKTIKDVMDNIPERDKGNYLTIPIGLTSDNKTVYLVMPHDFQGQVIGGMLWKSMRLGKSGNIGDIIDYMSGGLPYTGLNPILGLASDWKQYFTGKNPYDPFRGKYVLPETIFEAGGKEAIKEMGKYSSNQLGGGIVYRFKGRNVREVKSELEKILGLPIAGNFLSRFLRVSDAGRGDELRLVSEEVRSERAKELVKMDEGIKEFFIEPSKIDKNPKEVYDLLVKNKTIQRHTYKEFIERLRKDLAYKLGSPESNAILQSKSTEEGITIALKIMEKEKQKSK